MRRVARAHLCERGFMTADRFRREPARFHADRPPAAAPLAERAGKAIASPARVRRETRPNEELRIVSNR